MEIISTLQWTFYLITFKEIKKMILINILFKAIRILGIDPCYHQYETLLFHIILINQKIKISIQEK